MKTSLITTVYNEEQTIDLLLESFFIQTKYPDEVIIVDGGSNDRTFEQCKLQIENLKKRGIPVVLLVKEGNRSVGRNTAVKHARGDIILCTDAGCVLDKHWIKEITKPFADKSVDVVAGYYKGKAETVFEKCLIPYVLVMPDRVKHDAFLPASRSMAFRKKVWEKSGGFDVKLSHNEDYAFAHKLKKVDAKIVFQGNALVYWLPRRNLTEAFRMFFRFAYGDAEAKILRPKVVLQFVRYTLAAILWGIFLVTKSYVILTIVCSMFILYLIWTVRKNYRYVKDPHAIYILPLLQLTSDGAIILGTVIGIIKLFKSFTKTLPPSRPS